MKLLKQTLISLTVTALTLIASNSQAQESKGWDRTVRVAPYLEPALPHPEQEKAARDKLKQIQSEAGRKPNILIILVDDMGYGDPGAFGGGTMAGAPTPKI